MAELLSFTTVSPQATKALGYTFGKKMKPGTAIALSGSLGSGKTTFVQGLAQGLGVRRRIASPTFVKMSSYRIHRGRQTFYHFDFYHLRRHDAIELGLQEILSNPRNMAVIEWPEKIKHLLPARTLWINFKHDPSNQKHRIITVRQ